MKFTYQQAANYLAYQEVEKNKIYCEFRTAAGEIVTATARIKKSKDLQSKMQDKFTRTATRQVKSQASRLIRRALGGGFLGRTGATLMRSTIDTNRPAPTYSQEAIQDAIADAFRKVATHFEVAPQPRIRKKHRISIKTNNKQEAHVPTKNVDQLNPPKSIYDTYIQQFQQHANNFDKEILGRMLVELAKSDGRLSIEEEQLLDNILPEGVDVVAKYDQMEAISRIECEEVSKNIKEAMYVFAWIIALIDFDLNEKEQQILLEYASLFSFSNHKVKALVKDAQLFVLEGSINTYTTKSELFELADKLKLEHDHAERLLIQLKKRS